MSRPVVLLHGFTGTPQSWDRVVSFLGEGRVAAMALFGHAPDLVDVPVRRFEDEVDRLAALIEPLTDRSRAPGTSRGEAGKTPGVHLSGYSLGGRVALGLLVRHPSLFSAATIIGAHPGLESDLERAERRAADRRWQELLEQGGIEAFADKWQALPLFATQSKLPAELRAAQERRRLSHDPAGLARSLAVLGLAEMPAYGPRLGEIRIPVTLMAGEHDEKFRRLAETMAERLPNASLTVVPGAGHNLPLERPEAVARAIITREESSE